VMGFFVGIIVGSLVGLSVVFFEGMGVGVDVMTGRLGMHIGVRQTNSPFDAGLPVDVVSPSLLKCTST